MRIWVSPYIGIPNEVSTDQGRHFTSLEWKGLVNVAVIKENASSF